MRSISRIESRRAVFISSARLRSPGRYRGTFTERMFVEAEGLDLPYFRTKHESEGLVRSTCRVPWRIYRPGMVVGHSRSGVIDKIDGPYYLFKPIQKLRDCLPRWVPLVGIEGGHINLVPVDFVAAALVHLAHAPGQDGECFHLTDPQDHRVGDVLNLFARAAHAPTMMLRFDAGALEALSSVACGALTRAAAVRGAHRRAAAATISAYPRSVDRAAQSSDRVRLQRRRRRCSHRRGFGCLPWMTYAWRLWDYWERCLDPRFAHGCLVAPGRQGQDRTGDGWLIGDRASHRAAPRAGGCAGNHRGAGPGEVGAACARRSRPRGGEVSALQLRHRRPQACDSLIARLLGRAWAGGYSDQQCRPIDPARDRSRPMNGCMIMSG